MEENVIIIGKKPMSRYIITLQTLMAKRVPEIIVKARGNAIVKAINLAEFAKRVHNINYELKVKTEEFTDEATSRKRFVSAVEILIKAK